jgi:hypothetical protein
MQPTGPPSGDADGPPGSDAERPAAATGRPRPDDRRRSVDVRIALISAVATVLAAVVAGVLAVNTGTVEVSLADSGTSSDDLQATITSIQRENEVLRRANEELESELESAREQGVGSPAGDAPPSTSPEPSGDAVVREGNDLPLAAWYGIDLDTNAPDWGVVETGEDTGDIDVYIDDEPGLFAANGAEVALMPELPSFGDCRQTTGLSTSITYEQTAAGAHVCVRSSQGAYAYVGIVEVVADTPSVALDVTVWAS